MIKGLDLMTVRLQALNKISAALRGAAAIALCSLLWTEFHQPALAEATITGTVDDVRVEANSVTAQELLSDLRDKYGLIYQSTISLNQTIEGSYSGPLARIIRRLLKQYDYILKNEHNALFLLVTNRSESAARPVAGNNVAQAKTPQQFTRIPSAITSHMQTQISPLTSLRDDVRARMPAGTALGTRQGAFQQGISQQGASQSSASQATIAELTLRANTTIDGLKNALSRLAH